jgi:hypothetical protein
MMAGKGKCEMSVLATRANDVCRIVVVYEDAAAHDRAMELAGRLEEEMGAELPFIFESWNFKNLGEPASAREATSAAARADIILVSAHGNDLPSAVGRWLELCALERTTDEGALALFLAEPFMLSAASEAVITRLQHAAGLLRMDFVSLIPYPAEQIIRSFKQRSNVAAATVSEYSDRPGVGHWGLNE